jgi:hypothetical protein
LTACRPTKIPRIRTSGTPTPRPTPTPTLRVRGLVESEASFLSVDEVAVGVVTALLAPVGGRNEVALDDGFVLEGLTVVVDVIDVVDDVEDDNVVGEAEDVVDPAPTWSKDDTAGGGFPMIPEVVVILK